MGGKIEQVWPAKGPMIVLPMIVILKLEVLNLSIAMKLQLHTEHQVKL